MASKEFQAFKAQGQWMPEHDVNTPEGLEILRNAMKINTLPGGVLPQGVRTESEVIGGVPCDWILIDDAPEDKVLLHIHGGSFISGETCTKLYAMIRIAQKAKANILSVDYRLAPEHKYPAAVEDCATVYKSLLDKGIAPGNIIVFGESAGATLALCTALLLRDQNVPQPKALVVLSPVTDLSKPMEERSKYAPNDPLLSEGDGFNLYIGEADPKNPYISPALGDLTGLPTILLHAGTNEILALDALCLLERAITAHVDIRAHFWAEMEHGLFLFAEVFPEATAAGDELIQFIRECFSI